MTTAIEENPHVLAEEANGNGKSESGGLDKTRLLWRMSVCLDALGWFPGELNDLDETQFEDAVKARARELRQLTERTESQIVLGRPIKVKLRTQKGAEPETFEVHPMTLAEDAQWRELAHALRDKALKLMLESGQAATGGIEMIMKAARERPQEVIEMFWAYCPNLREKRSIIEAASTSIEIFVAATEVLRFTSPFFSSLAQLENAAMEALLPTD